MDTAEGFASLAFAGNAAVRPVRPDDLDSLVALHRRLGPLTLRSRLLTPHPDLSPRRLARLTDVDGRDRVTYVAVAEGRSRLTGVGRFVRRSGLPTGDLVLVADDDGRAGGVELPLLHRLADHARSIGLTAVELEVLPLDREFLDLVEGSDLRAHRHLHCGVVTLTFPLQPWVDLAATPPSRSDLVTA
jgi:hypothetical protein